MESSDSITALCEVCSKLDIQHLTHPIHPCRNPSPCPSPPIGPQAAFFILGSIDEIKGRRFTCNFCKFIAESLDKEPSDLDGHYTVWQTAQLCNFKLPIGVKARDPSITHFHLTQLSISYNPHKEKGPPLPWELKANARDGGSSYSVQVLQVKARSCTEAGAPTAASPQTEEEFLDTIGGRYVSTEANVQLLRAWLQQCESEHGEACMPSSRLPVEKNREATFRPTFIVDVLQSCIVDTPSQCRYVALSYVWGKNPVFRHLLENTQDLRKTSSLQSLPIPATIRDAITLVHALGECYLWVDSLCIIQDDLRMQRVEMTRMGSIYSRALFTIIAATGDHANSGLPGVKRGSRVQVQKKLKLADYELLTVIDTTNPTDRIDDTVWAERGWTFQERVLSNRVLVFSENQVYWSCRAASHSEERALEEVRDIRRYHYSFPQQPASTDCLSWEALQPLEYSSTYDGLLYGYRQRRLTHQTDILNAFNGVSEILGTLQDDTFHWGLPESLFSYAVTWYFIGLSSRNHVEVPVFDANGSKQMVPIPSWSWAAWSGEDPSRPPAFCAGYNDDVRPVIHFDIVDEKNQSVRIKDLPMQGHPGDWVPASFKDEQPHQLLSTPQYSVSRIGQLRFWTSLANLMVIQEWHGLTGHENVRVMRQWRALGAGENVPYVLFPPPDFQPDPNSIHEIAHQDFIVVAARGPGLLILLAVEWRDGVAYRVGMSDVKEATWLQVENREWRLITLG